MKERPRKKNPSSPKSPVTNPIRVASSTQGSPGPSDESLSTAELPSTVEPSLPLDENSPPNSERSSSPSTITPHKYRMTINTGSDGDDEKSPTVARMMQIPRKSVGSGSSKTLFKKDTPQTPESGASGGDGTLRGLFRKKEGKAKDFISDSAKGKAAEQDERDEDVVTLKVSRPKFMV